MRLYPAIDIKGGQCVRLRQGLFDEVQVYSNSPADVAALWESQGARFLHLVDLDGALAGKLVNEAAIRGIVERVNLPVQLGGGVRTMENIKALLETGIFRVIIGTKAVEEPEFVRQAVETFGPEHIVVGIDAKDGLVATRGWESVSTVTAQELCAQMEDYGVRTIVYTDISKDGMMQGPNVAMTKLLSDQTSMDIIASGGVSSMADLDAVAAAGIHGAILGKALYEKKIDLAEAVSRLEGEGK
ncbi:1-(5-phosphoribosyl)-5-[(5-phosphoribosylamino)methylideneamino]imidazole-4-carboxamide isomerase [Hominifimenecus sp. rT4P-3]|uniref:1-(5-phosphoribosyl)-5-[(5- phosphoribosylamino)methylideneamino]imidazole-4- carboxamide isomerase n=1 Tax=Hominifimenecus sp. rT4P-3 TaxID=3242979 RepID=UPI003DA1CA49